MKIVFLAKFLPPYFGGMEKTTRLLCDGLRSAGASIDLVGVGGDAELVDFADRVIQLKSLGTLMSQPLFIPGRQLQCALESAELIIHNFPHPLLDWYALRFDRPRMTIYHAAIEKGLVGRMFYPLEQKLLARSSIVTVSSPQHLRMGGLSAHREKCRIVPFGIPEAAETNQEKNYILSVGRLVGYKGHDILINAMRTVKSRLIIVGAGPEEIRLKRLVARLGICHRVAFLKNVSDEHLEQLYSYCKVFVLPSITSQETFGMSLAEAMSYGKPVITTNLETGVNFVNRPDSTGLVVQRGDSEDLARAINQLLKNSDQRQRMGRMARKRVLEKFRLNRMIESYVRIAKGIVGNEPVTREFHDLEL